MKGLITALIFYFISYNSIAQEVRVLSLEDCIEIAIENNLMVKRSQLNLETSRINYMQSQGARLPDANVGANYGYNFGRSINPTTNQFISQKIEFTGFNGGSNVTLFRGFALANGVKQSKEQVKASEFDLDKAKNDISLNIATFYLNVIFNQELVENARYQLESSQQQLERTRRLVEIGSLPRTNELELISQVASNEVNVVNAENNLGLALLSLKQAMLIPGSDQVEIVIPEIEILGNELIPENEQDIYELALTSQPEIKSAESGLSAARYGLKSAFGERSPRLFGGASFNTNYSDAFFRFVPTGTTTTINQQVIFQNQTVDIGFVQDDVVRETVSFNDQIDQNLSKTLVLSLSIPIFNGFNTHSQIQRAKISLQQAEISKIEVENTLRQQIETAYNDARAALKTHEASQRQVEALEETFRAVENQYNLGAANFTDYQVASNNLFGARSDLVRAKYDYIFKLKILDFYQGIPISFDQ